MIKNESVNSIIDATDIVAVIGTHVALKKKGTNYGGLCPFHNERTPSFVVSPVKQLYKCFGCGEGGNVVKFVMQQEKLSFPESIEWLARFNNMPIEYEQNFNREEYQQKLTRKDKLTKLGMACLNKWKGFLTTTPEAMKYILDRGFTQEIIDDWNLGFALAESKSLTPTIIEKGYYQEAIDLGIIGTKSEQNYDLYQNRIIIPIHNAQSELVGFGGRLLSEEKKFVKYINSPESDLYHKGSILFGLYAAKKAIHERKCAFLVEGYFDVIRMHQYDHENTVGSCGTALTEQQLKLLKKYTDKIILLYDGDDAGVKAFEKALPLCLQIGFSVSGIFLPKGEDPDSFLLKEESAEYLKANEKDAIQLFSDRCLDGLKINQVQEINTGMERIMNILLNIKNAFLRENYYKSICNAHAELKMKPTQMKSQIDKMLNEAALKQQADDNEDDLPPWVDKMFLLKSGFVQKRDHTKSFPVGIYFSESNLKRVTNFTIDPLYHIYESSNNRRLVRVFNGFKDSIVEMPSRAFISLDAFETALIEKGNFTTEAGFQKFHFKRLISNLSESMPIAYELKTLGWQPEKFFAFSNLIHHQQEKLHYDDLGIVKIDDKHYLSPGVSKIHQDERDSNNPYENDLYLKYIESKITFEEWCRLFMLTYDENAPVGIAFIFITIFMDIVTKETKRPILYNYGGKGSGKSDFGESILWLFFSGKNPEGKLLQAYNLNPGQGTPYSFFSRLQRFRNCPALYNEFDENNIEDWKFGAFKASYDGEGREVGDGETGKKRKTTIQKTQGTVIINGQYLSTKDDGSVLSRSLTCAFSSEKIKNRTKEQQEAWQILKEQEQKGMSSLICELLNHRDYFQEKFKAAYWSDYADFHAEMKAQGANIEIRLLRNYVLAYTCIRLMNVKVNTHVDAIAMKSQTMRILRAHNVLLTENNALSGFWKALETLFDMGDQLLKYGVAFKIETVNSIRLKVDNQVINKELHTAKKILYFRMGMVYHLFARYHYDQKKKVAPNEDTLMIYMRDQKYYMGLCPSVRFDDKTTSCFAIDYELLQVNLEKQSQPITPGSHAGIGVDSSDSEEDLPF